MINTERGFGRILVRAQNDRNWITDQIHVTNHRGLNEIKIGILGVGEMGKFIGKTFKVSLTWLVSIIRIIIHDKTKPKRFLHIVLNFRVLVVKRMALSALLRQQNR